MVLAILRRWPTPKELKRVNPAVLRNLSKKHRPRSADKAEALVQSIRSSKVVITDPAVVQPGSIQVKAITQQIAALLDSIREIEAQLQEALEEHPDEPLFRSLPGAGQIIGARLIGALGSDRDRYKDAQEVAVCSGIAPVKKQSGNTTIVSRRIACSKFLRQTFHEFADSARRWSKWSAAFYALQKQKGVKHHAVLRKLAFKWIRIIFKMWKTREPYCEAKYLERLRKTNSPILQCIS